RRRAPLAELRADCRFSLNSEGAGAARAEVVVSFGSARTFRPCAVRIGTPSPQLAQRAARSYVGSPRPTTRTLSATHSAGAVQSLPPERQFSVDDERASSPRGRTARATRAPGM